jgi:hypothetical protein
MHVFYEREEFNSIFKRTRQLTIILSARINPTSSQSTRIIFVLILFSHRRIYFPSILFHSDFPTRNLYTFIFFPICTTCAKYFSWFNTLFVQFVIVHIHLPSLNHSVNIRRKELPMNIFLYLIFPCSRNPWYYYSQRPQISSNCFFLKL